MSLCLAIQKKDRIFIAADTAITDTVGNELYRRKEGIEKLFKIGDLLIFACGDLHLALSVIDEFKKEDIKSVSNFQSIIFKRYYEFISKNPSKLNNLNEDNDSLLSFFVCQSNKNGVVSYALNPENDFKPINVEVKENEMRVIAGGYKSTLARGIFINRLLKRDSELQAFRNTFESISGKGIGGNMVTYLVDGSGINKTNVEPINETVKLKKLEEHFKYNVREDYQIEIESHLVGGTINIGSGVFTVDNDGNMIATSGTFGGTLSAADGTFTGTLQGVDGTFTGTLQAQHAIIGSTSTPSTINIQYGANKYIQIQAATTTSGETYLQGFASSPGGTPSNLARADFLATLLNFGTGVNFIEFQTDTGLITSTYLRTRLDAEIGRVLDVLGNAFFAQNVAFNGTVSGLITNTVTNHNHGGATGSAGGHNHGITPGRYVMTYDNAGVELGLQYWNAAADHTHGINLDGSHSHTVTT